VKPAFLLEFASIVFREQACIIQPLATTFASSAVIANTLISDALGDTTGDTKLAQSARTGAAIKYPRQLPGKANDPEIWNTN
jgi:hypothetical protein